MRPLKHIILPAIPHFVAPAALEHTGLSVVSITKKFGKKTVLNDVSIEVRPSEVVGLLGRDGAGKTVTFYSILGLLRVNSGHIFLDGEELDALLDEFHIAYVRHVPARALSGGERRRCEIARAMAANPTIMLFDEPFAGIDPLSVRDIKAMIANLESHDVGILITDQNVREMVGILDRVYVLHEGRIVFNGTPAAMLEDKVVRHLYLGEEFHTPNR